MFSHNRKKNQHELVNRTECLPIERQFFSPCRLISSRLENVENLGAARQQKSNSFTNYTLTVRHSRFRAAGWHWCLLKQSVFSFRNSVCLCLYNSLDRDTAALVCSQYINFVWPKSSCDFVHTQSVPCCVFGLFVRLPSIPGPRTVFLSATKFGCHRETPTYGLKNSWCGLRWVFFFQIWLVETVFVLRLKLTVRNGGKIKEPINNNKICNKNDWRNKLTDIYATGKFDVLHWTG